MAVKNFEDLNVWKQARQLTQEVYRLTKTETFSRILLCGIKSDGQRSQSCQISQKDLNAEEIKSSFSSLCREGVMR